VDRQPNRDNFLKIADCCMLDNGHFIYSFGWCSLINVRCARARVCVFQQFKWTVAETKSLSRPLSAGQAGSVRSTPTNNRVLYGTRRSCVGNTLSSPSSSDAVVKQNAFPNASVGCVSSSSTRRLPQQPAVGVLTDATPELRRGLSPSTKTETRRFEDESDRSITTPNIHSVLARFKSIESLSTAHGQTSTVATPRVTASKPTVRLQATNGLDAMSKFWSMDNVAGPSAVLSVSRSADVSYQQPKHQQHQQEAVDQGHCETFDVENRHVAQPMVTNGQAHGSISTSIIPPFARIQLQRFRSLEELSQRPPTPTKPSASESGKRNAASPQLELNDSTSKSDVERIRDRYATGSATQTAVNGDASHLATSGALTTTATPSGSKRQYGASVSPSVCEARRYSASASPQNRAAAARQWSPIVRMASSDWSPFSSVAPSDIDNVIGNDGAASPRFSTLPPALQRRPFNASLPNSINTIPSNVSGLSEELSTSRATVRRLPNVPSTASVAANGTGTMHNRAVVDIYNDTDAPRKILTDFGLESSRETRHRQGDAVMTTDDAAGADVISTHVTVPVGMSQSEKTNSRSNGAMTSLVSEEPSVQPPKTSLPPTKSQLVLETSTSGLNTFDAKNDFDRSVVLSSPPPTAVKVMSSLFITLQPSNEGSGMKFNAQSGATSRIRVITSRRMN
jgi:hypothetical protein